MNLAQAIQALEQNQVQVTTDIGVHSRCSIDSNCPVAVELRKYIHEAGVSLEDLLRGFAELEQPSPLHNEDGLAPFDSTLTLRVAGKDIQLDLNDVIGDELHNQVDRKMRELGSTMRSLGDVGTALYYTYLDAIYEVKRTETLPQLSFEQGALMKYNIMVTSDGDNYIFLSPATYHPEYIIKDGIRYELSPAEKTSLRREVFFRFEVTRKNKFLGILLLDLEGAVFQHYHGRTEDCWGAIKLPRVWDKSLRMLDETKIGLINSLITINYNSMMYNGNPPGMPPASRLLERSTELGREGIIGETAQTGTRIGAEPGRTRWGRT